MGDCLDIGRARTLRPRFLYSARQIGAKSASPLARRYVGRASGSAPSVFTAVGARRGEWVSRRMRPQRSPKEALAVFEEQYDRLIDVVCGAAQEGAQPPHHERYRGVREWMLLHYRAIQPDIRPYWEGSNLHSGDPFEQLFTPVNIETVISSPTAVSAMTVGRIALDSYAEALQLPRD